MCVVLVCLFSLLHSVSLYELSTICLAIVLVMDIWVASSCLTITNVATDSEIAELQDVLTVRFNVYYQTVFQTEFIKLTL